MNIHKRFIAHKEYSRLDHFLKESLPNMSRTHIVKLLKENRVTLNGKPVLKKNHEICIDDVVELEIPEEVEKEYIPTFQFTKLFEDEHLLIIDKPAGISVHVGAGLRQETILDVFMYNYPQIKEIQAQVKDQDAERPGIVHRLDKDTSGIIILAKDLLSMKRLQKQFKRRDIKKTYLALAAGRMRYRHGTIDAPIIRSPKNRTRFMVTRWDSELAEFAREAVTDYSVIREFDKFSFVKLMPQTGRTHQLRVHLSHHGAPVLGDKVYGKVSTFERLALHAHKLEFIHPMTQQALEVCSPFPIVFREFMKNKIAAEKAID